MGQRDLLARRGANSPAIFYRTGGGDLAGLRYEPWMGVFMEQKSHRLDVWAQPVVPPPIPSGPDERCTIFSSELGEVLAGPLLARFHRLDLS